MEAAGLIGAAVAHALGQPSDVQTTIVTLDREWAQSLATELRSHQLPTRTPPTPTRWREHFDADRANCVIFDLDHGSDRMFDTIARLKGQSENTMVVAAASSPSVKTVVNAIRAGAVDFVNKSQPVRAAREQIQEAAAQARQQESSSSETKAYRERIDALTGREREVLRQIGAGLATKQIAHKLDLSPRTVEMFRRRIRHRLGASSMAEAVTIWMSYSDAPLLRTAA